MLRKLTLLPLIAAAIAVVVTFSLSTQAKATPGFARLTKMPCTSCHFGGTDRLTRVGRDFMTRGYRMADTESPKEPSEINISQYFAVTGDVSFTAAKPGDPSTSFGNEFHLFAGGPLYSNFGFFANMLLGDSAGDPAGIGDGFLHYNSAPAGDSFFFARAGKVSPLILKSLGVDPSVSSMSHTLHSLTDVLLADPNDTSGNAFLATEAQTGLSVGYRSAKGTLFEAAVTNGPTGDAAPRNDKGVFASIQQELDDEGSVIGLYGYKGRFPGLVDANNVTYTDDFNRLAFIGSYAHNDLLGTASYVLGNDSLSGGGNRHPKAFSLELAYNTKHEITPFIRYEDHDADAANGRHRLTLVGCSIRLNQIGRLVFEGADGKNTNGARDQTFGASLEWAF